MKRIEAFIQPHRLSKVVAALHGLPAFPGFTIMDAHGQGHGRGEGGHFTYDTDDGLLYHPCRVLLVFCDDEHTSAIVQEIAHAAHTGKVGDGIIAVSAVGGIIHIRDSLS